MQRKRTILIAAVVALVATAATLGIVVLGIPVFYLTVGKKQEATAAT